eukprot:238236_1
MEHQQQKSNLNFNQLQFPNNAFSKCNQKRDRTAIDSNKIGYVSNVTNMHNKFQQPPAKKTKTNDNHIQIIEIDNNNSSGRIQSLNRLPIIQTQQPHKMNNIFTNPDVTHSDINKLESKVMARFDRLESMLMSQQSTMTGLLKEITIIRQQQEQTLLSHKQINSNASSTEQKQTKINPFLQIHNHSLQQLPDINSINCDGKINNCSYLLQLKQQLHQYQQKDNICSDISVIQSALDNFLHLIDKHNENDDEFDNQFDFIYHALGGKCDIKTCIIFERHNLYRDQNIEQNKLLQSYIAKDPDDIAYKQILDKIHCFYRHCYDIGNKLTKKDKNDILDEMLLIKNRENKLLPPIGCDLNPGLSKTMRKLKTKYKMNGRFSKFSQISHFGNDNINNDYKEETKVDSLYNFGYRFQYDNGFGLVVNKPCTHNNLKEELLLNNLSTITKSQFYNELKKAHIHFDSQYCRLFVKIYQVRAQEEGDYNMKEFRLHHLLSLMFYCNYDTLQKVFSETYRKCDANETPQTVRSRHSNFYFLGKYLYQAVNWFGVNHKYSKTKIFYHGINKPLLFPRTYRSVINCPLSTSSSREVAINFATNEGIILEITVYTQYAKAYGIEHIPKHFPLSWLSDYGNEHEHLFVQHAGRLTIENILLLKDGMELRLVLQCISILHCQPQIVVSDRCKDLMHRLVNKEMSSQTTNKNKIESYAENLFHQFCVNKKEFLCSSLSSLCFLSDLFVGEWINLDFILQLFPHVQYIKYGHDMICGFQLSENMIKDIYRVLMNNKLRRITLLFGRKYAHSTINTYATRMRNKYQPKFKDMMIDANPSDSKCIYLTFYSMLDYHDGMLNEYSDLFNYCQLQNTLY